MSGLPGRRIIGVGNDEVHAALRRLQRELDTDAQAAPLADEVRGVRRYGDDQLAGIVVRIDLLGGGQMVLGEGVQRATGKKTSYNSDCV